MARDCKNPTKSWGTRVSSGDIAVEASAIARGAAAGVLDPTLGEASGRALFSELQPSGSGVSLSWGSVMDMRDNELSPPSFGECVVADDTIRNLSNESNDDISNTVVIDEGDVTFESSVNNTVEGNKNNSDKNSNNGNKNSNVNNSNNATIRFLSNESNDNISNTEVIDEGVVVTAENSVNNTDERNERNCDKNSNNSNKNSNAELSNEQSQSQDSSSSDLSQSVLLVDAEMIEASGVRKRGISSVDVSSNGTHTPVPASRKGAKKRVSARASSQEPRRAVHANLPSAASYIPLRKRS